jgi:hypothetical protein
MAKILYPDWERLTAEQPAAEPALDLTDCATAAETLDALHTQLTDGEIALSGSDAQELSDWLHEIIFTARETILELEAQGRISADHARLRLVQ